MLVLSDDEREALVKGESMLPVGVTPYYMSLLDRLNPQTAAKLVPPLGRWRRFDEGRAALMKAQLNRIVETPGLSRDVFEQVSKSLAA